MLGANPYESNGSLATAPDWPGRIEALIARGGTLVVVDPRRSRTAEDGEPARGRSGPAPTPFLLMALVNVLAPTGLVELGAAAASTWPGVDEVLAAARPFTPEAVAGVTGVDADDDPHAGARPGRRAHRLRLRPHRHHDRAVRHADVVAGRRAQRAHRQPRPARRRHVHRAAAGGRRQHPGRARRGPGRQAPPPAQPGPGPARDAGRAAGGLLAEEIDTPGRGPDPGPGDGGRQPGAVDPQRGPARRRPGRPRVLRGRRPLRQRDDPPRRRHPAAVPSALQKGHYDLALLQLALRNVANYSPAVLPLDEGQPDEWQILARLALVAQGMGADADPAIVDDLVVQPLVEAAVGDEHGPVAGRDPDEIVALLGERTGPERLIDLMLRTGPYGDGFGATPGRPVPRRAAGNPARRRPRAARAPAARRAAHADGHGRAGARADRRRRRPAAGRRSTRRPAAARWSAAATCAPTTRGCTTSRSW